MPRDICAFLRIIAVGIAPLIILLAAQSQCEWDRVAKLAAKKAKKEASEKKE